MLHKHHQGLMENNYRNAPKLFCVSNINKQGAILDKQDVTSRIYTHKCQWLVTVKALMSACQTVKSHFN